MRVEPKMERKCALYLRVSTDLQAIDEESLEGQVQNLSRKTRDTSHIFNSTLNLMSNHRKNKISMCS